MLEQATGILAAFDKDAVATNVWKMTVECARKFH